MYLNILYHRRGIDNYQGGIIWSKGSIYCLEEGYEEDGEKGVGYCIALYIIFYLTSTSGEKLFFFYALNTLHQEKDIGNMEQVERHH